MCEITDAIAELEREAQDARRAIAKSRAKQRKLLAALQAEEIKESRTREQHLDRPNRLIADLLLTLGKIDGGDAP